MKDRLIAWLIGGAAGIAALSYIFRSDIGAAAGVVMDDAKRALFPAVIPAAARPYANVILQVAAEQSISPFLITAIAMRESGWGTYLMPQGPSGTGDYGHGRGLMQIDDRSFSTWLQQNDWTDPYTNITKGVQILKGMLSFFSSNGSVEGITDGSTVTIDRSAAKLGVSPGGYPDPRPLTGNALTAAAVAAYNTGPGNVLMALAAGLSPDTTTTPGPSGQPDYSSDVLARADGFLAAMGA